MRVHDEILSFLQPKEGVSFLSMPTWQSTMIADESSHFDWYDERRMIASMVVARIGKCL